MKTPRFNVHLADSTAPDFNGVVPVETVDANDPSATVRRRVKAMHSHNRRSAGKARRGYETDDQTATAEMAMPVV